MYTSLSKDTSYQKAIAEYGSIYEEESIESAQANTAGSRTFINHDTNMSVLSAYSRRDYEWFRYNEAVPQKREEILKFADKAYDKVSIVKNVVDIMGDFGCQGIRLQHPNKNIENFYNRWFRQVQGAERSERFLNYFYRLGVVFTKRMLGKIKIRDEDNWRKSYGEDSLELEKLETRNREIPLQYSFLNPLSIDIIGGNLSTFTGKPYYALKISAGLRNDWNQLNRLKHTHRQQVETILDSVPEDLKRAITSGAKAIPLDQTKIQVFHYRKDDWKMWGNPMVYSIFDDLMMLEKLKLADASALDGAISHIRLWNLGIIGDSPETSILPSRAAMQKLRNMLANAAGGGTKDFVWGPELKFTESQTRVHQFLGIGKYEPHLNAIYDGLGIPPVLRSGASGNNTGSFMALKTMVERLEYGRRALEAFWKKEIEIVQKAMGFRFPAQVVFDQMILSDEAAEKALLVQLADRDIISMETLLEKFDILPDIEKIRIKRESKDRGTKAPEKASPFHNPQADHELKKIILQGGGVAPSELGVELLPRKEGEETRNEQMEKTQVKIKEMDGQQRLDIAKMKPVGTPGGTGRPKNVTETKKRKPKPKEKPRTTAFVDLFMWSNSALKEISEIISPAILDIFGKKNLRSLTRDESTQAEKLKFTVLCNMEPFEQVTKESVYNYLQSGKKVHEYTLGIVNTLMSQFISNVGREPNLEEIRQMQSSAYALLHEEEDNNGDG